MSTDFQLTDLALGQKSSYRNDYDPGLLQAVPRSINRQALGCADTQPFSGSDVWHAYELSWLNSKGKPIVALARFVIDANTPNIIESKSFKLYLNSFNQSRVESKSKLVKTLSVDLSAIAVGIVAVELFTPDNIHSLVPRALPGICIDDIDIEIDEFTLAPELLRLKLDAVTTSEILHSHLLKSNCLITNQPDWASVVVDYRGLEIDHEALLRYLLSFRLHNEFHEQCVERIYSDILKACSPDYLSVQALYTRRGGLDINPFRASSSEAVAPLRRINRQ